MEKKNKKYYYGQHTTSNLKDCYAGSGTILKDQRESVVLMFAEEEEKLQEDTFENININ